MTVVTALVAHISRGQGTVYQIQKKLFYLKQSKSRSIGRGTMSCPYTSACNVLNEPAELHSYTAPEVCDKKILG